MVRIYRYRLTPTRAQEAALRETLERLRELYNAALQHRREAWSKARKQVSLYEQQRELIEVRQTCAEYKTMNAHLLRDPLRRLDRAYAHFFRKIKAGEKVGLPRYRAASRYRSFTCEAGDRVRWIVAGGKRLRLPGLLGEVRIRLHRPFAGQLREVKVVLDSDDHWYALLVCRDVPPEPLPPTLQSVGVDLGIQTFAMLSDGQARLHPRAQVHAAALAKASRVMDRRERRSARRDKARRQVARWHGRAKRARRDFHHKLSRELVERYDWIAVEELSIGALASSFLAKHVRDAGWSLFLVMLAYKAESAGREVIRVDPRGTSQECSACGDVVAKALSERVHQCPCGLTLDRDHNAAIVIHRRGHRLRGGLDAGRPDEPRSV